MITILVVAMMVCVFGVGKSYGVTGNYLMQNCEEGKKAGVRNKVKAFDLGLCMGFINGAWDTLTLLQESIYGKRIFCAPEGVNLGQVKKIVEKYFNDHPEKMHRESTYLINDSLREAFPCPKEQEK